MQYVWELWELFIEAVKNIEPDTNLICNFPSCWLVNGVLNILVEIEAAHKTVVVIVPIFEVSRYNHFVFSH